MNVAVMRAVDKWIGVPLCAAATLLEKLRMAVSGRKADLGERLLVMKLSELGANVMLGNPVRRLRSAFARENTWFIAFEESRAILELLDFVPRENLIFISVASPAKFVGSVCRALLKIRREKISTVLDLEFFSRASALLAWLSGARRRVGIHNYFGEGPYRGHLMTHPIKFNPHLHISQMFQSMAEAALLPEGVLQRLEYTPAPTSPISDRFVPTAEEQSAVEALLRDCGFANGERIVLLNTNISDRELIPLRKWDEANYAEVGRRILAEFPDVRILLTGSGKEREPVEQLARAINSPRCQPVAGRTTLRELFTLYSRSWLMITNDSGPAHFATLTDMAIIVLFGPESPQLWTPLGKKVRVIYRGLACSPCFSVYNGRQSGCHNNRCMQTITVDQVLEAVSSLDEPRPASR